MCRAVRKKKQPRLKLGQENELVRGSRGPAGRLLPALDPGLPGAIGHLPLFPRSEELSDTRGSIKRLTRSPARFTSVSWKMAEGLGAGGLPSRPD